MPVYAYSSYRLAWIRFRVNPNGFNVKRIVRLESYAYYAALLIVEEKCFVQPTIRNIKFNPSSARSEQVSECFPRVCTPKVSSWSALYH